MQVASITRRRQMGGKEVIGFCLLGEAVFSEMSVANVGLSA